MKKRFFVYIMIITLSMVGCGKKDSQEIEDKLSSLNNTESESSENSIEDGEIYNLPDSLSYEVNSKLNPGTVIKVDATVSVEQTDNISVYSIGYTPMDDAYIKKYGDMLFDNGEYEIIKPYGVSSMEELNVERNRATDIWNYYGGTKGAGRKLRFGPYLSVSVGPEDHIETIDMQIGEFQESDVVEYKEGQLLYEESYSDLEDVEISGEVLSKIAKLRGTVDGEEWELSACYMNEHHRLAYGLVIMTNVYTDTVISQYTGLNDLSTAWYGENKLDIDAARADAEEFLDKIGFEVVDNVHTYQIVTLVDEKEENDGYCFIFSPRYDDLPVAFLSNQYGLPSSANIVGLEQACVPEYIYVNITSEGIMDVSFTKGYDNLVEMTDDAILLDFDEIDLVAKQYIEENYPYYNTIGKVELKYVIACYGNEDYAVVPAWIYSRKDEGVDGRVTTCFGVNALDGSIIEFDYLSFGCGVWMY